MDFRHIKFALACACVSGAGVVTAVPAVPAAAQGSYSPYNETATAALARYVRMLASGREDFQTLIGAGRSALEVGDAQAAAGFFARADAVNPRSPLPQAGMGAVSVANGEPLAALPYFKRAQQLGGRPSDFACDRGLAYDLLGRQADAQADYRMAQSGPDADQAKRRLALSLAISGNRAAALQTLSPLMARRDPGAARARAFVLALTGDSNGAMSAFDAAMPGSWSRVSPFLQRLPALKAGEKAAAVNLGIFPENGPRYAYAVPSPVIAATAGSVGTDLSVQHPGWGPATQRAVEPGWKLAPQPAPVAYAAPLPQPPPVAYAAPPQPAPAAYAAPPPRPVTVQQAATPQARKIWLQLASGPNAAALPGQYQRIKSKRRDLFDGITPYVARNQTGARLVIGPFRGSSDAEIFAEDLETLGVDSFKWSNSETDQIVPLGAE